MNKREQLACDIAGVDSLDELYTGAYGKGEDALLDTVRVLSENQEDFDKSMLVLEKFHPEMAANIAHVRDVFEALEVLQERC